MRRRRMSQNRTGKPPRRTHGTTSTPLVCRRLLPNDRATARLHDQEVPYLERAAPSLLTGERCVRVAASTTAVAARTTAVLGFALLAMGCGSEIPLIPLCDGADALTLRIFSPPQPEREFLGGGVRIENGYPSFAVDGQCRYYISGGWRGEDSRMGRDVGWRTGHLSDDLRRSLEEIAGSEDLAERYPTCVVDGTHDAVDIVVANSGSAVRCVQSGNAGVRDVFEFVNERAQRLRDGGEPVSGHLHVTAWGGLTRAERPEPYEWPPELVLADYFEADATVYAATSDGLSQRVSGSEAAPLRQLRERYLNDLQSRPPSAYDAEGIPITDGNLVARLFMRDALPYEDENGVWPIPLSGD